MNGGIVYEKLDCLNVLEIMEDKKFSLIYLDLPYYKVRASERIVVEHDSSIEKFYQQRENRLEKVWDKEIELFFKRRGEKRRQLEEEYVIKIIQNCFRVLKDDGVLIYQENLSERNGVDIISVLNKYFCLFGKKILESKGKSNWNIAHFFSKQKRYGFPTVYELESFIYFKAKDDKGCYRLESLEKERTKNGGNYFEWNGYKPSEKKEWIFSKDEMEWLNRKGEIVVEEDEIGNSILKYKYYREEHPVATHEKVWPGGKFLKRSFDLFVQREDKVLSISDEDRMFAMEAKRKEANWYIVARRKPCIKRMENYVVIDKLPGYKEQNYDKYLGFFRNIENLKKDFYEAILEEYNVKNPVVFNKNSTTNEILIYHIDKYMQQEKISESKLCQLSHVSRGMVQDMRSENFELLRVKEEHRKLKATVRDKKKIINLAIYTNMGYFETKMALKASGHDFDENHPIDSAIIEWLCGSERDINALNRLIKSNCEKVELPESEYDDFTYEVP